MVAGYRLGTTSRPDARPDALELGSVLDGNAGSDVGGEDALGEIVEAHRYVDDGHMRGIVVVAVA